MVVNGFPPNHSTYATISHFSDMALQSYQTLVYITHVTVLGLVVVVSLVVLRPVPDCGL